MLNKSNISKINFKNLYIEQKNLSDFKEKNPSEWDEKANSFNDYKKHESYINEFIKNVDFTNCKSLIDFACGAGLLAKACSNKVDELILYDFSPKMCELAKINCPNAKVICGSFDDLNHSADLVFASRCLGVNDLSNALEILLSKTKKRLYFTYKIDETYISEHIINALNIDINPTPNYIYAANILYELGYFFTLNKISIEDKVAFTNYESLKKSVEFSYKKLSRNEEKILKELYLSGVDLGKSNTEWALFCVGK